MNPNLETLRGWAVASSAVLGHNKRNMKKYTLKVQLNKRNNDGSDGEEVTSRYIMLNAQSDNSAVKLARLLWTLATSILEHFGHKD